MGESGEEVLLVVPLNLLVQLVEQRGVLLLEGEQAGSDVVKQERHPLYICPREFFIFMVAYQV